MSKRRTADPTGTHSLRRPRGPRRPGAAPRLPEVPAAPQKPEAPVCTPEPDAEDERGAAEVSNAETIAGVLPPELLGMIARKLQAPPGGSVVTLPFARVCRAFRAALEFARLPVVGSFAAVTASAGAFVAHYGPEFRPSAADGSRMWSAVYLAEPREFVRLVSLFRKALWLDRLDELGRRLAEKYAGDPDRARELNVFGSDVRNAWLGLGALTNTRPIAVPGYALLYAAAKYGQEGIIRGMVATGDQNVWSRAAKMSLLAGDYGVAGLLSKWCRLTTSEPLEMRSRALDEIVIHADAHPILQWVADNCRTPFLGVCNGSVVLDFIIRLCRNENWPALRVVKADLQRLKWFSDPLYGEDFTRAPGDIRDWICGMRTAHAARHDSLRSCVISYPRITYSNSRRQPLSLDMSLDSRGPQYSRDYSTLYPSMGFTRSFPEGDRVGLIR